VKLDEILTNNVDSVDVFNLEESERRFRRMACDALCRLAERCNRNGKCDESDAILAFANTLVPAQAEIQLCQSRILASRGLLQESECIRSKVIQENPWVARLEEFPQEVGSFIRVRNRNDYDLVNEYTHDFEDSPVGLLEAMNYARSKEASEEFERREKEYDYEDSACSWMTIERCSGSTQTLGEIDFRGGIGESGIFSRSPHQLPEKKLVFSEYEWPNVYGDLLGYDAGKASQILLILQAADNLLEEEVKKVDLTHFINVAKLTGTEDFHVLSTLRQIVSERYEERTLKKLSKKFLKSGFQPVPSQSELKDLMNLFRDLINLVAQNTYRRIQEDLERTGVTIQSQILEDLKICAAPKIVSSAYEVVRPTTCRP